MGAIRRLGIISTGRVRIRPDHVKYSGAPTFWWLLTSRTWTKPRPINVYVIEHDDGLVLFDTGQDRASVTDPSYFPRGIAGLIYRRLAEFTISETDTLTSQLRSLGYEPEQVAVVVLSHLHQDHIGGLAELPNARILIHQDELSTLDNPFAAFAGLLVSHIKLPGLRWEPFEFSSTSDTTLMPFNRSLDVFGDGRLVLLPTPGHTPGSLSMLLRESGMPAVLLVGDLTYDIHCLETDHVPGVGNRRLLHRSTRMVSGLKKAYPDLLVAAAHDPSAAQRLDAALPGGRLK
jgi:N-acyl homoserine lactone hydrolase